MIVICLLYNIRLGFQNVFNTMFYDSSFQLCTPLGSVPEQCPTDGNVIACDMFHSLTHVVVY